jgi:hypothetical protein
MFMDPNRLDIVTQRCIIPLHLLAVLLGYCPVVFRASVAHHTGDFGHGNRTEIPLRHAG